MIVSPLAEFSLGNVHLRRWLEGHNFDSRGQVRGRPDPVAYERGNDLKMLSGPRVLP